VNCEQTSQGCKAFLSQTNSIKALEGGSKVSNRVFVITALGILSNFLLAHSAVNLQ